MSACVFAVCSAASRESAEEMLLYIHSNSCFCQPLLKDNAPIVVSFRKRHYKTSNCDRFLVVHVSFFPPLPGPDTPRTEMLNLSDGWSACVRWKTHLARNALMEPVFEAVIRWFGIVREALLLQADARFFQSEVKRWLVSVQSWLYREGEGTGEIGRALACIRWWFVLSVEFSGEQEADSFQLRPGSTTQVWEKRRQNNEFYNWRSETAQQPKKKTQHTNKINRPNNIIIHAYINIHTRIYMYSFYRLWSDK